MNLYRLFKSETHSISWITISRKVNSKLGISSTLGSKISGMGMRFSEITDVEL